MKNGAKPISKPLAAAIIFDVDDMGLNHAADYPQCFVCMKKSDGAKIEGRLPSLCGTDFDLWLRSYERKRYYDTNVDVHFMDFVRRVQAERGRR